MNKRFPIRAILAFIPQIIFPTGLYMAGDKNILSIKDINQEYISYRLPDDEKGAQFTLNFQTTNPIHIYATRDKTMFDKKMNPPMTEDVAMENDYVSISDKRLIAIFHYMLTTNMPNRRLKITDTANILKHLDEAMLVRCGKGSKQMINRTKWKAIKEELSDAIISRELSLEQSKNSIVPVQISQATSSNSGLSDSDNE